MSKRPTEDIVELLKVAYRLSDRLYTYMEDVADLVEDDKLALGITELEKENISFTALGVKWRHFRIKHNYAHTLAVERKNLQQLNLAIKLIEELLLEIKNERDDEKPVVNEHGIIDSYGFIVMSRGAYIGGEAGEEDIRCSQKMFRHAKSISSEIKDYATLDIVNRNMSQAKLLLRNKSSPSFKLEDELDNRRAHTCKTFIDAIK